MEKITTFEHLYFELVGDLYDAEVLQVSELFYLKNQAESHALERLIQQHINDSRNQIQRLEDHIEDRHQSIFEDHCRGLRSMIDEAKTLVSRCKAGPIRDYAIAFSLQRINQCEIIMYSTLITIATKLALSRQIGPLQKSLEEEMFFKDALLNSNLLNFKVKQPVL